MYPQHAIQSILAMYASPFARRTPTATRNAPRPACTPASVSRPGSPAPHRTSLVTMLFSGFVDAIAQAKGALLAGQVEAKGVAIGAPRGSSTRA